MNREEILNRVVNEVTPPKIIADFEIMAAFNVTDFEHQQEKRNFINQSVLMVASEIRQEIEALEILLYLGLIKKRKYKLTEKGKLYLWSVFKI